MGDFIWWRDGVIYQIYPRSFADTDNNGFGDLPGISTKLDYLVDLGVDAIWLSPFYPSPDKDFGYDISNYIDVDSRFGTLEDFDTLLKSAHKRGIRIILDLVLNHTSDQHPWFVESRSCRSNPKRDWYIWRSNIPNNWQASFGGKSWQYDPASGEYYLHLFTKQQPDLNWRNPEVQERILDIVRFWLERGVDGFRLDVFNAYFKHPELLSNPRKSGLRAFDRQHHINDMDQPEMMPFLKRLRAVLDEYPERYAVGETYLATLQKTLSYCGSDKLHAAFGFEFTSTAMGMLFPWNPDWIGEQLRQREVLFNQAGIWPTTVLGNHDLPRLASRYTRQEDDTQARLAMGLLLTARGTPFLYYGDELGMRELPLKRNEILDPPGKKYWPIYKGRDGCRSPMQWNGSKNAGFSDASPWLPVHPNYKKRNAEAQLGDTTSIFNLTRTLIAHRRAHPALTKGDFSILQAGKGLLAFTRKTDSQSILVILNFSKRSNSFSPPAGFWHPLYQDVPNKHPFKLSPGSINLYLLESTQS